MKFRDECIERSRENKVYWGFNKVTKIMDGDEVYYIPDTGHSVERIRHFPEIEIGKELPEKIPEFPLYGLWWSALTDEQLDLTAESEIAYSRQEAGLPIEKSKVKRIRRPKTKVIRKKDSFEIILAMLDLTEEEKKSWLFKHSKKISKKELPEYTEPSREEESGRNCPVRIAPNCSVIITYHQSICDNCYKFLVEDGTIKDGDERKDFPDWLKELISRQESWDDKKFQKEIVVAPSVFSDEDKENDE